MELRSFCAYLHGPIVNASDGPKEVPIMSPKELIEFRSHGDGRHLLDALLYSMSTGQVDFNWEVLIRQDSQDYQKKFLSAMVASDVLLQNVRDGVYCCRAPNTAEMNLFTPYTTINLLQGVRSTRLS